MESRADGWMDRWRLDVWREVCSILASIHRRAHQRRSDIYGAAACPQQPAQKSVTLSTALRKLSLPPTTAETFSL